MWVGGYAVSVCILAGTVKVMRYEDMPKTAVMTSCFFVASLVHVPLGPTGMHLMLNGLVGIILGKLAFLSVALGLTLQALLFQHGGITTIGVNSLIIGIPALIAYLIFRLGDRVPRFVMGALAGAIAIVLGCLILAIFLVSAGEEFVGTAKLALLAHIPVALIEALISGSTVAFLSKVKPEILGP